MEEVLAYLSYMEGPTSEAIQVVGSVHLRGGGIVNVKS